MLRYLKGICIGEGRQNKGLLTGPAADDRCGAAQFAQLLEPRLLLSVTVVHHAAVKPAKPLSGIGMSFPLSYGPSSKSRSGKAATVVTSRSASIGSDAATPSGLTPQQIRGAYGVSMLNFNGVAGDGTGETIAILDPGDDPAFVDSSSSSFATSDLAEFDAYFGLPNPPSFTKMGFTETDSPQLTTTLPAAASSDIETALDVEWAHVMAPNASILLVEGPPDFTDIFDGVLAVDSAASSMHIVALSMSFGGSEAGSETSTSDAEAVDGYYFDTPGLVYLASTGDYGAYAKGTTTITPSFPATSSNVLAVGGTTLSVNGNSYVGETTWGNGTASGSDTGGGGGFSVYEPQPAYQVGKVNGLSSSARLIPDISMDANPGSGVPIYDTVDDGSSGWFGGTVGGTSLASPLMAGLIADADQGRALEGLPLLNSSGGSGVAASNPNGNASSSDIHTLLYGYGYSNNDFHDITSGSSIGPSNYGPLTGYDLSTGIGSPVANNLVVDLSGTASVPANNLPAVTNLYVKEYSSTQLEIWVNSATPGSGTPSAIYPLADISGINYVGGAGNDVFTLDYSNGNFTAGFQTIVPPVSTLANSFIYFVGSGSANQINFVGTTGNDLLNVSATRITAGGQLGSATIGVSNVQAINFAGGSGGSDTLNVTSSPSGGYTVNANTASGTPNVTVTISNSSTVVLFAATQHLAGLSVETGATATLTQSAGAGGKVLVTSALAVGSTSRLDLTNNGLILNYSGTSPIATVAAEIASAYNGGGASAWTGNGITSSLANASTHGVGYGQASQILGPSGGTFLGQSVGSSAVLIRYTMYGDANLDGTVDAADFVLLSNNFGQSGTYWSQGNFNYDSVTDAADFVLLSNNFGASVS